jgi:hypothetical protein
MRQNLVQLKVIRIERSRTGTDLDYMKLDSNMGWEIDFENYEERGVTCRDHFCREESLGGRVTEPPTDCDDNLENVR